MVNLDRVLDRPVAEVGGPEIDDVDEEQSVLGDDGPHARQCPGDVEQVVDRLDDDRLEVVQGREARRTAAGRRRAAAGGTATSRRARVERSRERAQSLKSDDAAVEATEAAAVEADTAADTTEETN